MFFISPSAGDTQMDDLIVEFLTETNEGLQELDTNLIRLEQNPNDKDLISKIFRLMHTIKGTCGFLGLPRLETVAHRAENVMGRFRDGDLEVTPAYVSLILESLDRVRFLLGHIEANGTEPDGEDSELIAKLDAVYEGRDGSPESDSPLLYPLIRPTMKRWLLTLFHLQWNPRLKLQRKRLQLPRFLNPQPPLQLNLLPQRPLLQTKRKREIRQLPTNPCGSMSMFLKT
jgi:HPt (histidine-containing phosphotransfer) domain-containing protein